MTVEADHRQDVDPGLFTLLLSLRCCINAEVELVRQRCGSATVGITEMQRCAKDLGLKAHVPTVKWKRLASTPVPVIASLRGGGFLPITKVSDDKVVVLQPSLPRPDSPRPKGGATVNALFNGADVGTEISRYLALDVPMGNVAAIFEERATERPRQFIESTGSAGGVIFALLHALINR